MMAMFGPVYSLHGLPLRLSTLTEAGSSVITVSSCGVYPLRLGKITRGIHMHFCGFSQHYYTLHLPFFSFHSQKEFS